MHGYQSTRHTVMSSLGQLVTSQLVSHVFFTESTCHTVKSSHSHLVTSEHCTKLRVGHAELRRRRAVERKNGGRAKGFEGETRIQVEGGVLLGANPCKSCNRFLNNYRAEFGLKQHLICGAKLAYVHFHFRSVCDHEFVVATVNWLWSRQPYCSVCVVMALVRGDGVWGGSLPPPQFIAMKLYYRNKVILSKFVPTQHPFLLPVPIINHLPSSLSRLVARYSSSPG